MNIFEATRRDFTGHEMADDYGIINMNGRIYDPLLNTYLIVDSQPNSNC